MSSYLYVLAADAVSSQAAEAASGSLSIGKVALYLLAGAVLSILANWISSVLFATNRATLGRAVLLYLAELGLLVAAAVTFALGVPILVRISGKAGGLLFGGGVLLLTLALIVAVPVKLYLVGMLRSLGLIVGAAFLSLLFGLLLQMSPLGDRMHVDPSTAQAWATKLMPVQPIDRATQREELRRRQAELVRRYELLRIRHRHTSGDPESVSEYLKDLEAYKGDCAKFADDSAAFEASAY